jgi:hypothetical protein
METRRVPRSFWLAKRKFVPIGLLLSGAWLALAFSNHRRGSEIYALAFGAYFLFAYVRSKRGGDGILKIPDEYRSYEIYGFFGGCFLVGMTLFVLAVLGVAHIGLVIGTAALVGAAVSGCAIVREAQNMRRRREVHPPSAF